MDEPAFKQFDDKLLTQYILDGIVSDLRTDNNKNDMINSINYLFNLPVTKGYFEAAMQKLFFK